MSKKKVIWQKPKVSSAAQKPGTYKNFNEFLEKANKLRREQEKAHEYLKKATPAMTELLKIRLENREPLVVMRPIQYQTSDFAKSNDGMDEIDKAFYQGAGGPKPQDEDPGKFVDKTNVIYPGTQLVLKSLDMPLREFIFEDGQGKEHSISFDEKQKLLTQTDIFEAIQKLMGEG